MMISDRKLAANRENARKSSGPRSDNGKRASSKNALRHGLAIPIGNFPALRAESDKLALSIARANGQEIISDLARQAAEAELDLLRIQKCRIEILNEFYRLSPTQDAYRELDCRSTKLARYEDRAFSRRNRALRAMESDRTLQPLVARNDDGAADADAPLPVGPSV